MELTSADAPPQFPTEGVDTRQLPADLLWGTGAWLGGAGASAEVQRGLGAGGGWGGHQGVVGRSRAAGGAGGEVQNTTLAAHGGAEGELARVDRGGGAQRDGERGRGGELARQARGFAVQVVSQDMSNKGP